jgi:hypothetical protein
MVANQRCVLFIVANQRCVLYIVGVSTRRNRWDETPKTDRGTPGHTTPGQSTPGWAETPRTDRTGAQTPGATPTPGSKRRSRWDETPSAQIGGTTPMIGPSGVTPAGPQAMQMATPTPGMCACFITPYEKWIINHVLTFQAK